MPSPRYWREIPSRYRLEAGRCRGCGRVAYPARTAVDMDRFLSGIGAKRVSLQLAVTAQPAIRHAWRLE